MQLCNTAALTEYLPELLADFVRQHLARFVEKQSPGFAEGDPTVGTFKQPRAQFFFQRRCCWRGGILATRANTDVAGFSDGR